MSQALFSLLEILLSTRQISVKLVFQSERNTIQSKNKHRSNKISDPEYYEEKLNRIRKRGLIMSVLLGGRIHA